MKTPTMRQLTFAVLILLAPPPVRADEVRLDDGRVLVGKVVVRGDTLEVTTRDGVVVVPKSKVVGTRDDQELRAILGERARASGSTAFAHLHLAMDARAFGLEREMWSYLDKLVAHVGRPGSRRGAAATGQDDGESDEALQRRIDDFLGQLEPELLPRRWRNAATRDRVKQLLDHVRADTSLGRAAAVEALLAIEPNADQDLRTEARRPGPERRRIAAIAALARRELAGNHQFVLRTAVLDSSAGVRRAAIDIGRGYDDAAAVAYLAPGLLHGNGKVRIRTGEAFAALGHPDAVQAIVMAGPNAGAGLAGGNQGARAHVAFLQQQAYIRDYDVEVAQAAFIADPKVDVLHSGTVLDVTVVGVYEEVTIVRAWQKALKDLTSKDPGADPRQWSAWYAGLRQDTPSATRSR